MNILEIYKKYQIMPQLAEHQLRVASVADMICENFTVDVDRQNIVAACLLHDMGNILKFDLTKTNSLLNREINIEFWQKVKDEYRQKYGEDEHKASIKIAKELNVSNRIIELIDAIDFDTAVSNAEGDDFSKKICEYADDRVGPGGVVTLEQRFADLRVRYAYRALEWGNIQKRDKFENGLREIEKQIFRQCSIKPEDITETVIAGGKERLKNFEI